MSSYMAYPLLVSKNPILNEQYLSGSKCYSNFSDFGNASHGETLNLFQKKIPATNNFMYSNENPDIQINKKTNNLPLSYQLRFQNIHLNL